MTPVKVQQSPTSASEENPRTTPRRGPIELSSMRLINSEGRTKKIACTNKTRTTKMILSSKRERTKKIKIKRVINKMIREAQTSLKTLKMNKARQINKSSNLFQENYLLRRCKTCWSL